MLLKMMKLRLGLTMRNLSDRFKVSIGVASSTIVTWVKLSSSVLKSFSFLIKVSSIQLDLIDSLVAKMWSKFWIATSYSLRHQKILCSKNLLGQNINITIHLSFLLHVLQILQLNFYQLLIQEVFLTKKLLTILAFWINYQCILASWLTKALTSNKNV